MEPTLGNDVGQGFDFNAFLSVVTTFFQTYWFPIVLVLFSIVAVNAFKASNIYTKLMRNLEDTIFHNWRLVLLGVTGLVLSAASGWTTWDGMRNFTHEPVLSLMITFGIQGVMLIAAWLIGESFATGMNQRAPDGGPSKSATEVILGTFIGLLLFIAIASWGMSFLNVRETISGVQAGINWGNVANGALILVIAMLALASMLVNRKSDVVTPYLQGTRVVAKNAVLWMMFLACMGTSVFFSFDSLFSNIFPQSERQRAATIRTTNQVAAIVSDIGMLTARRQLAAAEQLFRKDEWNIYERQLTDLADLAKTAPGLIRAQIQRELEKQNREVKILQEKRANATSAQAGLAARKIQLSEEISRLSGLRPGIANDTLEPKAVVANLQRELDEQRAKTLAEERGVEGSLKVGRGPKYRASRSQEALLRGKMEVARTRLKTAERRLKDIDRRVAGNKGELARIDGDLAKLKGEAATADQLIAVTQTNNSAREDASFDPAIGLVHMERARQAFHREPTQQILAKIQTSCGTIHSAMMRVDQLKDRAAQLSCDPGPANEVAAPVFALNSGISAFAANCSGGSKLPQGGGTDAMLRFGRQCLQDSGLPSQDTAKLGAKISSVELARDDKAHRFVVTWNAFQDGNALAYLALGIAIAIDALVFMSGLFGANVVRSPLSDVPTTLARSAKQLDAIVDNALLPDRFENAALVLAAMHPITPQDGFTAEVILDGSAQQADDRIRKVLNAGATIGTVRRTQPGHYQVRSELFEFLSLVAKREFDADKQHGKKSELEKIIAVALLPDEGGNAELVLSHMHPINEQNGFTSEIFLHEIDPLQTRPVRNVLNAGSTLQVVQRDKDEMSRYYIHGDLYKTLASIRARALIRAASQPLHQQLQGFGDISSQAALGHEGGAQAPLDGGDLTQRSPAHDSQPPQPRPPQAPQTLTAPANNPAPVSAQITQRPHYGKEDGADTPPPSATTTDKASSPQLLRSSVNLSERLQADQNVPDQSAANPSSPMRPIVSRRVQELRDELSAPLGFKPGDYGRFLSSGISPHAPIISEALHGLDHRAPEVWRHFGYELGKKLELVNAMREQILNRPTLAPADKELVVEIVDEIKGLIEPLMLTRGGSYEKIIGDLLFIMETPAGEGKLDAREEAILVRLKNHFQALQALPRQSEDDWRQVAQLIKSYDENVSVVQFPSGEQRPN